MNYDAARSNPSANADPNRAQDRRARSYDNIIVQSWMAFFFSKDVPPNTTP